MQNMLIQAVLSCDVFIGHLFFKGCVVFRFKLSMCVLPVSCCIARHVVVGLEPATENKSEITNNKMLLSVIRCCFRVRDKPENFVDST